MEPRLNDIHDPGPSLSVKIDECLGYDPQSGPFIIGLTGAMATGKSSVLARLVERGAYPIDCDKVQSDWTILASCYDYTLPM